MADVGEPGACRNCGLPLQGEYCAACGQKRFDPADRGLPALLRRSFAAVTDVDGRFLRSLVALLFRPGVLDRDWIAGRRRRWLPPVTLFLLANLAYFLAPLQSDLDLRFEDQVPSRIVQLADRDDGITVPRRDFAGQKHSPLTAPLAEWLVERRDARDRAAGGDGYGYGDLRRDYAAASGEVSKALLVLHAPMVAVFLALAMLGAGFTFAEHGVVALHFVAFALLELLLLAHLGRWLMALSPAFAARSGWFDALLVGLTFGYALVQVRRAYAAPSWRVLLGGGAIAVGFWVSNLYAYRAIQFVATLAWS